MNRKSGWGGVLLGIFAKSTKLIKILKGLKFAKIFLSFFSMMLSMVLYSWTYGLALGVGFIVLLFIHEIGHVIAINMRGLVMNALVFIPGLGAGIFMPETKEPEDEAFVAIGGPLIGGLAAVALYGVWLLSPEKNVIIFLLAYLGVWMNLFNLIPMRPLDGGRIMGVVSPWFRYIGLAAIVAMIFAMKEVGFILIILLSLYDFAWPAPVKFHVSLVIMMFMVVGMASGFTRQPAWICWIDISLVALYTFIFWNDYRKAIKAKADFEEICIIRSQGARTPEENAVLQEKLEDIRSQIDSTLKDPPKLLESESRRWVWTLRYLCLAGILGGVLFHQAGQMDILKPHIIETHTYK